ncbi:MAG: peptide-methionine (S)-S-oxide reductase MsrA [Phycisphaerae bacterium]
MEVAVFGAGCFWGVEETFRRVEGVTGTAVGYAGGTVENPTYEMVCEGTTGHAEVTRVEFDPGKVSFGQLLDVFWQCHNPTTLNRQGPDVGTQYRSVIFCTSDEQRSLSESSLKEAQNRFENPIVTQVMGDVPFFRAEEYHQQYIAKGGHGGCQII